MRKMNTHEKLKQVVYAVINGFEGSAFDISFDFELKVKRRILKFTSRGTACLKEPCLNPFKYLRTTFLSCVINFSAIPSGTQFSFPFAKSREKISKWSILHTELLRKT